MFNLTNELKDFSELLIYETINGATCVVLNRSSKLVYLKA